MASGDSRESLSALELSRARKLRYLEAFGERRHPSDNNAVSASARCACSGVHGALLNYHRRCTRLGGRAFGLPMAPRRNPLNVMRNGDAG